MATLGSSYVHRLCQKVLESKWASKKARRSAKTLSTCLTRRLTPVRYPGQELELSYPMTKGKAYTEEDRYLLCRLHYYATQSDDVYECLRKDVSEFPVFHFNWFLKSRSPGTPAPPRFSAWLRKKRYCASQKKPSSRRAQCVYPLGSGIILLNYVGRNTASRKFTRYRRSPSYADGVIVR